MALTKPFAQNGDKKTIPENTTGDGSLSYETGFGSFYALPPEEGGLFIDRAQFNQLMYDTTSAVISNQNSISTLNSKVVNLTGNQTIAGVKTFSSPPVSATNPTANNQVANKAYVDSVGNTAVKLTGNQTIAGVKTFSSPIVVPNGTANTHAVNLAQLNTKANANATVNLSGNQTIAGVKTFTSNITAPNITTMQNNLNTIFSSTTSPVRYQNSVKIITVGTGGNFTDLLSAFNEAKAYTSPVTIQLISNLNVTGKIEIKNLNGFHISIDFNNFKIKNTNSTRSYQIVFSNTTVGEIKNLNLEGYTFSLQNCSMTTLVGTSVTIKNGSYESGTCINVLNSQVMILDNININVSHGTRNEFAYTFVVSYGGIFTIRGNVTINDTSTTGHCIFTHRGGIVVLGEITINSTIPKANQAAQAITANGVIFGTYSL